MSTILAHNNHCILPFFLSSNDIYSIQFYSTSFPLLFNSIQFYSILFHFLSQYFALASKMDPLHPLPFVNAARTYTQLSQPTNAAKHLARAISVDPALATTR